MKGARRVCRSCGSRACETPFPERGKLCCDCVVEVARDRERRDRLYEHRNDPRRVVMTRASWRARLKVRAGLPQLDLIDRIQAVP